MLSSVVIECSELIDEQIMLDYGMFMFSMILETLFDFKIIYKLIKKYKLIYSHLIKF